MRAVVIALLAVDLLQLVAALVVTAFAWRRLRFTGAVHRSHARYGFSYAASLAAGGLLFALPLVLGLAGAIAYWIAIATAAGAELAAVPAVRGGLGRLQRAHVRRVAATGE